MNVLNVFQESGEVNSTAELSGIKHVRYNVLSVALGAVEQAAVTAFGHDDVLDQNSTSTMTTEIDNTQEATPIMTESANVPITAAEPVSQSQTPIESDELNIELIRQNISESYQ